MSIQRADTLFDDYLSDDDYEAEIIDEENSEQSEDEPQTVYRRNSTVSRRNSIKADDSKSTR